MPHIEKHAPGTFCWIELATTDQGAAKAFYCSLFGWAVNDFPMGPNDFYTMFQLEGRNTAAAYTLRPEQRSHGVPPHWMIYIAVESSDRAAERANQLGGKVLAAPFDVFDAGRMAVLQDPTGAAFSLWQAKEHRGLGIAGVDGTLCWVDLMTSDPARANKFYSELFGWKLMTGEKDPSGYLHIMNGEEFIGGIPPANNLPPGVPPHWLAYLRVSDCDASAAKAKSLGGTFHVPPMTLENVGRFAVVADPQGAVFAIFKESRRT
ncbi:MAG: VOC family protein [Acidobacteriia bacterium]|nr:VOC family protein [Terriglobia bacterium]